jgi:splicing factor 3A subunit 3
MDSIIEVQRQTHEEVEHFERALYQTLARPTPLHQQKVQTEHKASQILDRISARVNALNNLYQNDDTRREEIIAISSSSGGDDLSEFYSRLGKIQEHHGKYPDGIVDGFELELLALTEDPIVEEGDEEYAEEDRTFNVSPRIRLPVSHMHL